MNHKILAHLRWLHEERNFSWFEPADFQLMFFNQKLAILFSCFRYQFDIDFIEYCVQSSYKQIPISNYLNLRRFTDADRKEYGANVEDPIQKVEGSLRVISSGLSRRCDDILSGDTKWLEHLRSRDRNAWEGLPLDTELAKGLSNKLGGLPSIITHQS